MHRIPPSSLSVSRIEALPRYWATTTYICENLTDDEMGRARLCDWFERAATGFAKENGLERIGVLYTAEKFPDGLWEVQCKFADPADRRIELA